MGRRPQSTPAGPHSARIIPLFAEADKSTASYQLASAAYAPSLCPHLPKPIISARRPTLQRIVGLPSELTRGRLLSEGRVLSRTLALDRTGRKRGDHTDSPEDELCGQKTVDGAADFESVWAEGRVPPAAPGLYREDGTEKEPKPRCGQPLFFAAVKNSAASCHQQPSACMGCRLC